MIFAQLNAERDTVVQFPITKRAFLKSLRTAGTSIRDDVADELLNTRFNLVPVAYEEEPVVDLRYGFLTPQPPIDNNGVWTVEYAIVAHSIGAVKENLIAHINARRDALFWSDFPYESVSAGVTAVQMTTQFDRSTLSDLRQFAAAGYPVQLILKNNVIEDFTGAAFVTLTNAIMVEKSDIRLQARVLKDAIALAGDITELQAIDLGIFA